MKTESTSGATISVNQAIAHNLRRTRMERGETQEQAAALLEKYLGIRWAKQTFSAAERSMDERGRRRAFDVGELVAFAKAFDRPIAEFFELPDGVDFVTCGEVDESTKRLSRGELLEVVETPQLQPGEDLAPHFQRLNDALRRREAAQHMLATQRTFEEEES